MSSMRHGNYVESTVRGERRREEERRGEERREKREERREETIEILLAIPGLYDMFSVNVCCHLHCHKQQEYTDSLKILVTY
jgi:hypothetical protein